MPNGIKVIFGFLWVFIGCSLVLSTFFIPYMQPSWQLFFVLSFVLFLGTAGFVENKLSIDNIGD